MTGRWDWDPRDVRAALLSGVATVAVLLFVAIVASPSSLLVQPTRPAPVAAAPSAPSDVVGTEEAAAGRPVPAVEPVPSVAPSTAPAQPPVEVVAADLARALAQRDGAVARRTADGWTSAGGDPDAFATLMTLPLTRFETEVVEDTLITADGAAADDATAWSARVRTTYALDGTLAIERQDTVTLEPARDVEPATDGAAAAWRVARWEPWPGEGELGTAAPWELGPVSAARGERGLVLAWPEAPGGEAELAEATTWAQELAGYADTGAVVVDSYLGTGWPRASVLLSPATGAQFASLVPGPRPGTDEVFAALTIDVSTPDGTGDVVLVNPAARGELVSDTWQVTVTHELVHVASGALHGDTQELWLAEGLADLIGWSTVVPGQVDRELVAARLLSRVKEGETTVTSLPPRESFTDEDPDVVGDAYEGAWLAALLLEDELGTDGLLELYVAASDTVVASEPEARTDAAVLAATGEDRAAFEARWVAYVTALAADAR